jgi:hypothetical protein
MDVIGYLKEPVPRWLAMATVAAVGIASGGSVFFIVKKKYDEAYDEALEQEIEATRKFFTNLQKIEYPTPGDLARERGLSVPTQEERAENETILEALSYGGEKEEAEAVDAELSQVSKNVFTNYANNSTWDADAEEAKRDPSMPYVISYDEFFENQVEYEQTQLTYFAEDGVLADTTDKPVDESLVNPDNLEKFGHGSRDPNIVYVRNEARELDFEISYAEGKYADQVMGFIQHDDGPRKFRLHEER